MQELSLAGVVRVRVVKTVGLAVGTGTSSLSRDVARVIVSLAIGAGIRSLSRIVDRVGVSLAVSVGTSSSLSKTITRVTVNLAVGTRRSSSPNEIVTRVTEGLAVSAGASSTLSKIVTRVLIGKGMEAAMAHVAVILGGSGSMHRSIEVLRALERISGASGKHALKRRLSLRLGLGNPLMTGGLGLELRRDDAIVQVIGGSTAVLSSLHLVHPSLVLPDEASSIGRICNPTVIDPVPHVVMVVVLVQPSVIVLAVWLSRGHLFHALRHALNQRNPTLLTLGCPAAPLAIDRQARWSPASNLSPEDSLFLFRPGLSTHLGGCSWVWWIR